MLQNWGTNFGQSPRVTVTYISALASHFLQSDMDAFMMLKHSCTIPAGVPVPLTLLLRSSVQPYKQVFYSTVAILFWCLESSLKWRGVIAE